MGRWTLEINGAAYWLVRPDGNRGLILLRMDTTSVLDFDLYAQAIVDALNGREQEHDA